MTDAITTRRFSKGFVFGEGPRWHDGRFWVADQHAHKLYTVGLDGSVELLAELDDMPSGQGFLADGSLLVATMRSQRVLRRAMDGPVAVHADLRPLRPGWLNDMVVDGRGRAYLNFNQGPLYGETGEPDELVMVEPSGTIRVVAGDLKNPNGTAVTADNRTLVVAEYRGRRLTAFDIEPDGSLINRRLFAQFDEITPDGICLDAEGAVWIGSPDTAEFLRVREGGMVTDRIPTVGGQAIACVLGGEHRRTLFMLVARVPANAMTALRDAPDGSLDSASPCACWAEVAEVDIPGAGWP